MEKPTICIGENKDADQLRGNRAFVFATRIVQFLFYLNLKFQASSSFLCFSVLCVGPVRKPHCWFSHEAAHLPLSYGENGNGCSRSAAHWGCGGEWVRPGHTHFSRSRPCFQI